MAKKTINKELTGAQDLYNFLFEACNIIRGPVSQDNFKDYHAFALLQADI